MLFGTCPRRKRCRAAARRLRTRSVRRPWRRVGPPRKVRRISTTTTRMKRLCAAPSRTQQRGCVAGADDRQARGSARILRHLVLLPRSMRRGGRRVTCSRMATILSPDVPAFDCATQSCVAAQAAVMHTPLTVRRPFRPPCGGGVSGGASSVRGRRRAESRRSNLQRPWSTSYAKATRTRRQLRVPSARASGGRREARSRRRCDGNKNCAALLWLATPRWDHSHFS